MNGRLLAVGDELPGVRWHIERILADRVIAVGPGGGSPRALTLFRFESPNKKTTTDWNAPRATAPAGSAETNSTAGVGTNATASAAPAAADAKGGR